MAKRNKAAICTLPNPAEMKETDPVHIRWMVRRDLPEVMRVDQSCFGQDRWSEEQFMEKLRTRNVIGTVITWKELVVGFIVYELVKGRVLLLRFAVAPDCQRKKLGRQLIEKLKGKLSGIGRTRIITDVPEDRLSAQLFLRSEGFRATQIIRDYQLCYQMTFTHKESL